MERVNLVQQVDNKEVIRGKKLILEEEDTREVEHNAVDIKLTGHGEEVHSEVVLDYSVAVGTKVVRREEVVDNNVECKETITDKEFHKHEAQVSHKEEKCTGVSQHMEEALMGANQHKEKILMAFRVHKEVETSSQV